MYLNFKLKQNKVNPTRNMMKTTLNKQRIKYIDAMRGFTMMLVVFGHVMLTSFNLGGYNSVIGSFFLTFRMPMFFFISGYIAYKSSDNWNFSFFLKLFKKKAFVQIVPAFLFFSLFTLSYSHNFQALPYQVLNYGFGNFWFTFVLFEMFCIYFITSLISKYTKHWIVDISLVICSILGILWLITSNREGGYNNILCIENLAKHIQFFTFGILCKKYNEQFLALINNDKIRAIIILVFILGFYFYYDNYLKNNFSIIYSFNHDILIRYAGLLTIFIFFISKKEFFDENNKISKTLQFIGTRTLDIYLLHNFFIPTIPYITTYIQSTNMMIIQLFLSLTISIMVISICLICSEIIRTSNILAHWCFGVTRDK